MMMMMMMTGIDHMLAMDCFDEVRAHGGKVMIVIKLKWL